MASKLLFLLLSVYFMRVSCLGPELVVVPDSSSVEYGSTVIMSCVASDGFGSEPTILWSKNGQIVSVPTTGESDEMINITTTIITKSGLTFVWSTMRICNLNVEGTGMYSCTAANLEGNVTQKWNVSIAGARAAELVVVPETKLVEYHNTVIMVCVAYGFPLPTITFNKDGITLNDQSSLTVIHKTRLIGNSTIIQSTLVLCNIGEGDIGNYSCTADNGIGVPVFETWGLTVDVPAQLVLVPPDNQRVRHGSTVFMVCTAYGYPSSTIMFNRNGTVIQNSSEVLITQTNVTKSGFTFTQSVLTICGITRNESGEYSCTASNEHGSHSQQWSISLSHIPVPAEFVLVPPENQTLREGDTVFVSCIAYGIPLPNITWSREGVYLGNFTSDRISNYHHTVYSEGRRLVHSILEICDLMEHDAGTYSCEALNTVGRQSFDWHIAIEHTDQIDISRTSPISTTSIELEKTDQSVKDSTTTTEAEFTFNFQAQKKREIAIGSALGVFVSLTTVLLVVIATYLLRRRRGGCWLRRTARTTPNRYVYVPPRTLPNNPLEISLKELVTQNMNALPNDDTETIYEPIDTVMPQSQDSVTLNNFNYRASGSSINSTEFTVSFTFGSTERTDKKEEDPSLVVENGGYVNIVSAAPLSSLDTAKPDASPILSSSQTAAHGSTPVRAGSVSSASANGGVKVVTDETNYSVITLEAMEACSTEKDNIPKNTVITNEGAVLSVGEDDYEPMKPGVL